MAAFDQANGAGESIDFKTYLEKNGTLTYWNRGVSMRPLIRQDKDLFSLKHKDLVLAERGETRLRKYDVVLYIRHDGAYVLHRIVQVRANDYAILGDNTYRLETGITDTDVIAVMTGYARGGEHWHSVEETGYQLYSKIWVGIYPLRKVLVGIRHLLGRIYRKAFRKKS
ncbi:MAG: S24/S26 family peptidase [Lachnospiraceae bacterium]|nr:S24/S26 family peptidase [Lachnospiraceae bacterium]